MRIFTHEELSQMGEDWRRNDGLEPAGRMKRVAELHGCSPEEAAAALGMAMPDKKRRKSYDKKIKDDALKAVLLDGEESKSVAERLGVQEGTLIRWVSEARKKQKEVKTEPEEVKTEPEEVKTEPEETKPAGEPDAGRVEAAVDLKALEDAADGLLTFTDLFEEVGFLTAQQGRFLDELADQAGCYAKGIRWAMERSKR